MFSKVDFGDMFEEYVAGNDTSNKRVAELTFQRHECWY